MDEFPPIFSHTGLVVTGGGARSAYQAGALKGVSEIAKSQGLTHPFTIISGTSAGAINAAGIAAYAHNLELGTERMVNIWSNLSTSDVIKSDPISLGKIALLLFFEFISGGLSKKGKAPSLMDNSPLRDLLKREIPFENIQKNLDDHYLHCLAITAMDYADGSSNVFFHGRGTSKPWKRLRRAGEETIINVEHVMASSSIPLLFPPVKLGSSYFGDGSIRNHTPLSPPIKLGADRLLIITARRKEKRWLKHRGSPPTVARILGVLLNAVILDNIDFDYERLMRINKTVAHLRKDAEVPQKQIDVCVIRPSVDIGKIAAEESKNLPRILRYLLRGLGTLEQAEDLISYLLFEGAFAKRLIDLGYEDAYAQEEEIIAFLQKSNK